MSNATAPVGAFAPLADQLRPDRSVAHPILFDLALVFAGSLFISLTAMISIDLPFSPVPITGQSLGVLLVAMALGSKRGLAAVALYLMEGCSGWPVFAGGTFGFAVMVGKTGGYLLGFAPAAFLAGWLAERGWDRDLLRAGAAMMAGTAVIFLFGVSWLSMFIGAETAIAAGLLPFIPGGIVKAALGMAMLPTAWRVLGKRSER